MNNKFKKTYILGAILIIAVLIMLLPKSKEKKYQSNSEQAKTFSFEIKDVDKIELEYPDQLNRGSDQRQTVQLQKTDDKWLVASNNSYQAREQDVKTLLEKAGEISQGDLISSNSNRQDELEIGLKKGARVKLWQKDKLLADFWLGKSAAQGNATYYRAEGSDLVYSSKNNVRFYFTKPDWIDRTIFKLEKEKINKISLNIDKTNIVLEKQTPAEPPADEEKTDEATPESPAEPVEEKDKWQVTAPKKFEASESKINSLLSSLSKLSAQDIVFDKTLDEAGLTDSRKKITVYLDGVVNPYELIIGNKTGKSDKEESEMMGGAQEKYYVKTGNSDQIFTVGLYLVEDTFSPKLDDLKMIE